jgi:hypothetical protein
MRISKARGTEKGCETCRRPFEAGELIGYAGRGKSFHRGECAEAAGPAAFPGRPSRKGGWGTLGMTYGALAA